MKKMEIEKILNWILGFCALVSILKAKKKKGLNIFFQTQSEQYKKIKRKTFQ
jgi:hypothetical protein